MPSPCEVVEAPVHLDLPVMRSEARSHRAIPALVGSVFAGLLLIALGCTPLFKPASAKAAAEQPTIVQARSDAPAGLVVSGSSAAATPAKAATPALSPRSEDAGPASLVDHRFVINCLPEHEGFDSSAARPESVALQGIMSGQSSRAALLDGALYREGDRFGSSVCPWTVAMIDVASVRIEKTIGDRTSGVTITFSREKTQAAQRASR